MPATEITDYHAQIRDAVKGALEAACPGLKWRTAEDIDDALKQSVPVGVVVCVGPELENAVFGTNARDGITYPVAVLLLGSGATHGEKQTGPTTLTGFRRVVRTTFHNKRLSGVDEVCVCEVSDSGPLVDEKAPHFQKLQTALVVSATGRFPRT